MPKSRTRKKSKSPSRGTVDWSGGRQQAPSRWRTPIIAGAIVVALAGAGFWIWSAVEQSNAFADLAARGAAALDRVESERSQGSRHIGPGERVQYGTRFPTSGDHDPRPTDPGVYRDPQPRDRLVHALEHGNVVIYYDRPPAEVMETLEDWAGLYAGAWDGIVLTPAAGLGETLVLTAWTKRLRLESFDAAAAAAFIDAYRGRGPENPVR